MIKSAKVNEQSNLKALATIIGPHMTEKAYSGVDNNNTYVFKVNSSANKLEIKNAIESYFNVTVDSVKTLNVKGKSKLFKQRQGKRKNWKKAYIKLKDGSELDFIGATE